MSRPVGSKNKSTLERLALLPKKKGRPFWSKNKDKAVNPFIQYIDDVARLNEIKQYNGMPDNYDNIEFMNCTWHVIDIKGKRIEPQAYLRVSENSYIKWYSNGVAIFEVNYTAGLLPAQQPNRIFIVWQPVCMAAPERSDLYMPHKVNHITKTCVGIVQNPFYRDRMKRGWCL